MHLRSPLQSNRLVRWVQSTEQTIAQHGPPAAPRNVHGPDTLLNTSALTLHRQPKEEGATLQALKDEVRCEHAIDLLQRSSRPVKQVAEAAGFQNEKIFIRAFKGWTGMTPGEVAR